MHAKLISIHTKNWTQAYKNFISKSINANPLLTFTHNQKIQMRKSAMSKMHWVTICSATPDAFYVSPNHRLGPLPPILIDPNKVILEYPI